MNFLLICTIDFTIIFLSKVMALIEVKSDFNKETYCYSQENILILDLFLTAS